MNDLICFKLKEIVKLQDIVKKDDLKYRSERAKMLVNIHYLVFF